MFQRPCGPQATDDLLPPPTSHFSPQQKGVEQAIAWGGRILLGDEMGLGTPHVPITYMADYIVCVGARCAFCIAIM